MPYCVPHSEKSYIYLDIVFRRPANHRYKLPSRLGNDIINDNEWRGRLKHSQESYHQNCAFRRPLRTIMIYRNTMLIKKKLFTEIPKKDNIGA
ncbi:hypothetical protein NEIMUCOT_06376 [Neisseria mucosa ATCC 25996]|uniref:Uncharacterized protein n=1 Tax=Neisseria mucosa (strain ATCC 25996 / DSM 4631 / NCTC 10774 / M26) TaxID=546266 RepID=D3A0E2_NEIM2|nr:hypothetical protein NEIMUCOT_06376 [Neisseria mucosa ATCC 25996]